jgi:hypothetical protein
MQILLTAAGAQDLLHSERMLMAPTGLEIMSERQRQATTTINILLRMTLGA